MPVSDLPQAITEWGQRRAPLLQYRDYYDGRHAQAFASWKFRQRYRWLLSQARENLMPATVKAFTDLKRIEAWTSAEALDAATEAGMGRLAALLHREEFRSGNAFTITWKNRAGERRAVVQRPDQIVPRVDDDNPDLLLHATRVWEADGFARANIYHADRVERFISRLPLVDGAGHHLRDVPDVEIGWAPFGGDGQPEVIGHDFGAVPVCWWKRDADDQWSWGRSILSDAIPVQDELNYSVAVTLAAVERIARPIRYALAGENFEAPDGNVEFDPTREDVLTLRASSAGEFTGPNAASLVDLQNHAEQKIARVVGIPPYVFAQTSGNVPSGVSLRIVNERRTSLVRASNEEDSPVWKGQMQLLGFEDCSPQWADPMTMSEQEAADLALAEKDLGLPAAEWLRTAGYDPDATDETGATLLQRVEAAATASQADMARAFLNGDPPATYGA